MKAPRLISFAHRAQFPLLIALATAPASVTLIACFCPDLIRLAWLCPAAYALLTLLCLLLPGKPRLAVGVAGAAALLCAGVAAAGRVPSVPAFAVPFAYAVLLLWSLKLAAWSLDEELHLGWHLAGLLLHAAAQVMVNVAVRGGSMPAMLSARWALLACFALFLIQSAVSLSRVALGVAGQGRHAIPSAMRVKIALLAVALPLLALLLASIPRFAEALRCAWGALTHLIAQCVRLLLSLFERESSVVSGGAGGGRPDFLGAMEEAEPSALAVLLERVLIAVCLIAAVPLTILGLRFLWRRLRALARRLYAWLTRFAAVSSEDYVDEITDTRADGESRSLLRPLRDRILLPDVRGLPPKESIRRRYLRLRLRHPAWKASQTARETLPDDAAQLYERARYSAHEISEDDARRFERRIRGL